MESFIRRSTALSAKKKSSFSDIQIQRAKSNFQIWKNARNKHEVDDFYKDPPFGCIYVTNLYRCRVESFHEVLDALSSEDGVTSVLSDTSEVLSIGCGPGPEIAAYVDFVRNQCGYSGHLNILAVDAVDHWGDFIRASNDCDRATTIKFMNAFVDADFLRRNRLSGVCIMSYPESINFDIDFWRTLADMFDLVIVLDQAKRALHQKLQRTRYILRSLEYRGSKHYAFHLRVTRRSVRTQSVISCEGPCKAVTPVRNSIASSKSYSYRSYLDNSPTVITSYRPSVQPPLDHKDPNKAVTPTRNSIASSNSFSYRSYLDNSPTVIPSYGSSVQPPRAHESSYRAVTPTSNSKANGNSSIYRSYLDKSPTVIPSYGSSVQPPRAHEGTYRAVTSTSNSKANGNSCIYRSYLDKSTTVTSSRRPSVQPPRKKGFFEMNCKPCTIL